MTPAAKKRRVLVTAALPYSNGRPHVGHLAGAYVPADIYVRYLRSSGADVRFVCGSDDYGVAIMIAADKEGKTPAEVANFYREKQRAAFAGMQVDFDVYSGTSISPYHTKVSQNFFKAVYDKGYFEREKSRQFFDETKGAFLPDRYVKGTCDYCKTPDQNGDQCENCGKVLDIETLLDARSVLTGTPASIRETVHWFLDLSRFEDKVRQWLENAVLRDHTRSYVTGLLGTGLVKRAMTRDLAWGIPVPLDDPEAKQKVLYVWFDAPIGYISFTSDMLAAEGKDPESYVDWWKSPDCELVHFIGEDNTIFHCVIWIAMLAAEGTFSFPRGVTVNQYLNMQFTGQDVEKISKSRGNAVWIEDFLAEGGSSDALRYYLTSIAPERARTVYNPDDLASRYKSDLANTLGNLVNRTISFTLKHCGEGIPAVVAGGGDERDATFRKARSETFAAVTSALEEFRIKDAQEAVFAFARDCNKYLDDRAPWQSRKTDMARTVGTLSETLQAIYFLGVVLQPFIPTAAGKILEAFGREAPVPWNEALTPLSVGGTLSHPAILFPVATE